MIRALTGLRFWLCLSVLCVHLPFPRYERSFGPIIDSFVHNAGFAMVGFFVLSGFCTALGYSKKLGHFDRETSVAYLKRRLWKLYPLYFVTVVWVTAAGLCVEHSPKDLTHYALMFGFECSLLQSLSIVKWGTGSTWFVSTIFFCYLATPPALAWSGKWSSRKLAAGILICLLAFLVLRLAAIPMSEETRLGFLYAFPGARIWQYLAGLFLGQIFLRKNSELRHATALEFLAAALCLFALFFNALFGLSQIEQGMALLYTPVSLFAIWIFAHSGGLLSKILASGPVHFLGALSMEIFLIHYCVIFFGFGKLFGGLPYLPRDLVILAITFALSLLWKFGISRTLEAAKKRRKGQKLQRGNSRRHLQG